MALDVLNLNLETYVGGSGSGTVSGKRNTLCYFLIQRLTPDENIFFAEAKQLVFLSKTTDKSD